MPSTGDRPTHLQELADDEIEAVSGGLPSMEGPGWAGTAIVVVIVIMVLI